MHLAIMSTRTTRVLARESARRADALAVPFVVVDLDGSYVRVADEAVVSVSELGIPSRLVHLRSVRYGPAALPRCLAGEVRTAVRTLVDRPSAVVPAGHMVLAHASPPGGPVLDSAALRDALVIDVSDGDQVSVDGVAVAAIDLSGLDPERPWLMDARDEERPGLLSLHPALASLIADIAARLREDSARLPEPGTGWDPATTAIGIPADEPLRSLYGRATSSPVDNELPDPYDPADAPALRSWLTEPAGPGRPARYLEALLETRPDLQATFRRVPGTDTPAFLAWVREHGRYEGYPVDILDAALEATPDLLRPSRPPRPIPGVTVVGYLTGELGIGESARQLVKALDAAGVPHTARAVDVHLASRQRREVALGDAPLYDTTVICVNADLTPAVAATVPELVRRSYRIGMWYWEVEDFPPSQHGGFAAVDEVWVATDFVRRAIEPHSPVPVRTVTPPLPQRGPDPTLTRAELGLPDAPVFLFSFDYLSTAERKNPVGLVEAFERAFRPGEGPVLVIKSINADKRVADAERLRIRAASRPDVLLLEDYFEPTARDALVAHCDCYVSLHRSEGLGLTMAEAMAWGKPVIATGYSGNLQFMTEENSFLVPWSPGTIPADAAPYPPGGVWADPDLDAAARFMRLVVDSPDVAAARGARAAEDIATLHSAEAAGEAVAARLAELTHARRVRSHPSLVRAMRRSAHAAITTLRDELR